MSTATLRSIRDGSRISLTRLRGDKEDVWYSAELIGPRLSAVVEVYDISAEPLVEFFAGLATKWWDGWEGEQVFGSLEGHLELTATRDSLGHVYLKVVVCDQMSDPCWTASGTLEVGAGQLPEFAEAIRGAFRQ
jgi:hypothetical protein